MREAEVMTASAVQTEWQAAANRRIQRAWETYLEVFMVGVKLPRHMSIN